MAVAAVNAHLLPSPVSERRKRPSKHNQPALPPTSSNYPSPNEPFTCQTKEIIHETFHMLLTDQGIRTNGYTTGLVEPKFSDEDYRRPYHSLTAACRQFFKSNIDDMIGTVEKIDLSDSMLCTTFHTAMYSIFIDGVNWGRIVAVICFSVMLAAKAHRLGKGVVVDSIEGWLVNFICQNLQPFISSNKGWAGVPDKFNPEKLTGKGGSWLTLAAVGVGAALVTAFLSR